MRAGEAEDHGRRRGRRSTCGIATPAHHLPAGRAERERALLEIARDAVEELAADAGHDRDDHDREHRQAGSRPTFDGVPEKSGMNAEVLDQERLDVLPPGTAPSRGCPTARARRSGSPPGARPAPRPAPAAARGASSLRKSPIAIANGTAMMQRDERGHRRAPDQVARAELVGDRVPLVEVMKPEPERRDARLDASRPPCRRSGPRRRRPVAQRHRPECREAQDRRGGSAPGGEVRSLSRPGCSTEIPNLSRREGAGTAVGGRDTGAAPAARRSSRSPFVSYATMFGGSAANPSGGPNAWPVR